MELACGFTDLLSESVLDIDVNILEVFPEFHASGSYVAENFLQSLFNDPRIPSRDNLLASQHPDVGETSPDILCV
jgi:hypothetical protein